ncbi:OPN4 [Mytilus edulis]|uniref:OPN4 n=1 Tax=Mytilus edulis TaxID=6550 RepID=A0A8S3SD48_MYTED|nr:OPN4 [Mytilus edulis]
MILLIIVDGFHRGSSASPDNVTSIPFNGTTSVYDTYGYFIHPHWKQFPPVPDETKNLKTPSNMLIMNLALSDLVFSAVNGFPLLTISAFNRKWMWGDAACQLYGFIGGLFGLMSIITLAAISIDRYYNIAEPLKAAQFMTRRKAFMMIVLVWIWSLVWAVPPIFGWGAYVPEGFQTSCTFDYISTEPHMRAYMIGMYIGGFVLPLVMIIVSYVLIWKAIRKHENEMLNMAKKMKIEDIRNNQEKANAEVRIAKIAMIIVLLYLLSWSPYATVALIAQFGPAEWVTPYVSELPVMLAKAAAMHNPIVYAFSHPRFRQALHKRVPWLLCCCDVTPARSASTSHSKVTTKRQVSRQVSNDSYYDGRADSEVSSCISQIDDYGQSIEMKKAVSDTSFSRRSNKKPSKSSPMASPDSEDIVRELIQALVSVSNRPPAVQSQYTPNIPPQNNLQNPENAQKGVYVIDNGKQIDMATYLAHLVATGKSSDTVTKKHEPNLPTVKQNIDNTDASVKANEKKAHQDKQIAVQKDHGKDNVTSNKETRDSSSDEGNSSKVCYSNDAYDKGADDTDKTAVIDDGHV